MDAYRIKASIALASIELSPNKPLRVKDGRGVEVSIVYGSVWITQHQDPNDICLGAGESFCIDRDGATVVDALETCLVTPTLPATRDRAVRVSMVAAGTGAVGHYAYQPCRRPAKEMTTVGLR